MKQTVTKNDFVQAFDNMNRSDNFSRAGREVLFDYLGEIDENMELDVIAICGDFSEYQDIKEFQQDYSDDYETIKDIENETIVIRIDEDSFIIQQF